MRPVLLKVAATVLTLGATLASALYVTAHLKNPAAPLQPAVLRGASNIGGDVIVGPSVQPTNQPPVTSTYAS